jgi:branched-chain amino acid transport system ATP-binding protein
LFRITGINVFYEDLKVLTDISLGIEAAQIVSVVGSNGAGKSTLLKAISGLVRPKSGTITFLDERIDNLPYYQIVKMGIVRVPEGRDVFPQMTTLENLELGAFIDRAKKKRKDNLQTVFDLFPTLQARKGQKAGTLSGGEQQMLAVARGLMSLPKLLMVDELSLGLAPIIVSVLFEAIQNINSEGITILLVEQNIRHSLSISHWGYVLENGKIAMEGKGEMLLTNSHIKQAYLGV